jgi:eukaryotic-like serine/threonine-protein kinase
VREGEAVPSAWVLAGRYRVGALVRSSGIGEVREGHDLVGSRPVRLTIGRPVAPQPAAPRTAATRSPVPQPDAFAAAMSAAARIPVVPGAPWVHDMGADETGDGVVRWIASEPAHGVLVAEHRRGHRTDAEQQRLALRVALRLAGLLEQLHAVGVVHGALGPSTVTLASRSGRLLAVGIADPGQDAGPSADRRDDVAGIGRVLAALAVEEDGPDLWELLRDPPDALDLGEELDRMARQLTRTHRAERPYSARVVREQLAALDAAVAADRRTPGAGFAMLDAAASALPPPEVAALLGRVSAALPARWLRLVPGWRETVERLDLPVRSAASRPPRPELDGLAAYRAYRTRRSWRRASIAVAAVVLAGGAIAGISFIRPDAAPVPAALESPAAAPSGIVPELVGIPFSGVVRTLGRAGLRLGEVRMQDGDEPAGRVLTATSAAGARLDPGASVDITVASGRRIVPTGLVGRTRADAEAVLRRAGFRVAVEVVATSDYVTGYVLRVGPAAAMAGSIVTLTVAEQRDADPVPDPTSSGPASAAPSPSPSASRADPPASHRPTPAPSP